MAADSGNPICTFFYDTPCGRMQLVSAGDRLCLCDWLSEEHHGRVLRRLGKELGGDPREEKSEVISEAMRQLDEYFAKERKEFFSASKNTPSFFICVNIFPKFSNPLNT